MEINILNKTHASLYREIRLNSLKNNPEAFGSTYEREIKFSLETFENRLEPIEDGFVLGAFNDKSALVGIVSFLRENSLKTSHKGNVFGMYVTSECRGQGLGKLLLIELIRRAKNCVGLEQINLTVVSENKTAKKLYESLGFKVYGVEKNALKYNEQYFDEDMMVLYI